MLTYPWKCTVLHCNHLGNTWKPLVLMTRHFDYCPSASEGDNQSVRSSAPVVSRCFPGGYNVKLYISRGRLAWWLLAFLHSGSCQAHDLVALLGMQWIEHTTFFLPLNYITVTGEYIETSKYCSLLTLGKTLCYMTSKTNSALAHLTSCI